MKYICLLITVLTLISCKKETEQQEIIKDTTLAFATKHFSKKTSLPCREECTYVDIEVPLAQNTPVIADSINNKIFNTVRNIVYAGEKPSDAKSYEGIMESFIGSFEEMVKKFPEEGLVPWEAKIKGSIAYQSKDLLNIKMNNYTFTGGAHGYEGDTSLLFDLNTGFSLEPKDIFTDVKSFTALAETKFREKYKIPASKNINATGLFFENDSFKLPMNIFYAKDGLLLYYNAYEAGSYADGAKEVLIPYSIANDYLKIK